jgi:hypothetical protein
MKTLILSLKKSTTGFFAMRFTLVIGILIFNVSFGKSQTSTNNSDSKQTIKTDTEKVQPVSQTQNHNTINNTMSSEKLGEHAPDINAPDFKEKKTEWIKNYPEEYEACLKRSSKSNTGTTVGTSEVKKPATKVAEHAPYSDDPDYAAKKVEWIKNYPEEYNALINKSSDKNASVAPEVKQIEKKGTVKTSGMALPGFDATKKQ